MAVGLCRTQAKQSTICNLEKQCLIRDVKWVGVVQPDFNLAELIIINIK